MIKPIDSRWFKQFGWNPNLCDALQKVPFDYTIHDYYAFCPRIFLLDHNGQFCHQPDAAYCEHCIKSKPLDTGVDLAFEQIGGTIDSWRSFHQTQLSAARRIIAPCRDTAQRFQRALAIKQITIKPHDEAPFQFIPKALPPKDAKMRIAIIGAIGPHKGYHTLLALARQSVTTAPLLHFVIVGYTMDDTPFAELPNVSITGAYAQEELPGLLDDLDCHVALFLSIWPETYSYTLTEALRAGLIPVAPALGALGKRIAAIQQGYLLPENPTPQQIIDCLQTLHRTTTQQRVSANDRRKEKPHPPTRRKSRTQVSH